MNDHCEMYETLTMEEKLLVNIEMRKWIARATDLCFPISMFKIVELDFIEKIKRKETHDKRNRKSGASRTNYK